MWNMIVRVSLVLNSTAVDSDWSFDNLCDSHLHSQSELMTWTSGWWRQSIRSRIRVWYHQLTWYHSLWLQRWPSNDHHTGCRNVSHCQQQSYSGLRSPSRRSCSTYIYLLSNCVKQCLGCYGNPPPPPPPPLFSLQQISHYWPKQVLLELYGRFLKQRLVSVALKKAYS